MIRNISPPLFVLTGGPGSGKTTLLEELKKRGYSCVRESARQIIQDQVAIQGNALPWKDKERFRDLMFEQDLAVYQQLCQTTDVTFFDRGLLDNLAYSTLVGLTIPEEIEIAAHAFRYNHIVFFTPPWEEIYCCDAERKQSFEESLASYHNLRSTYLDYGYQVIEIPKVDVQTRANFILETMNLPQ